MNFILDPDERALQEGIRDLCRRAIPMERVRRAETEGFDSALWRELGAAGVFSLRLPEPEGGLGLGASHAAVVFEELGKALVPGPLVGAHLAAGIVEGAATGEAVVGIIERDEPVVVEHLDALDALLVLDGEGLWRVDPRSIEATLVEKPLDPLTPLWLVRDLPRGDRAGGPVARRLGAIFTSALLLGIAARTTETAVDYAKQRRQFDRPIGSFQAVKHICADMLVRTEVARSAVYAAGVIHEDPTTGDPEIAAASAKLLASEAAVANAKACIQVHGGMGFTWEVDAHLYLKRAAVLATQFGGASVHADKVAASL